MKILTTITLSIIIGIIGSRAYYLHKQSIYYHNQAVIKANMLKLVHERDSIKSLYYNIKLDAINASAYLHDLDFRSRVNVPDSLYMSFTKYND